MCNLYQHIESLCKQNGITITEMCKRTGINRSNLTELKTGRTKMLSFANMSKVQEFFCLDNTYLHNTFEMIATCPECFCVYDKSDRIETLKHNQRHEAWKNAIKNTGLLGIGCIETLQKERQSKTYTFNYNLKNLRTWKQ